MTGSQALDAVLPALRCPRCHGPLSRVGRALQCPQRHLFDVARQSYVNLAVGSRGPGTGDSVDMVAARERVFDAGLLGAVLAAVAQAARPETPGIVLDLAGGTGRYAAAVLDAATVLDAAADLHGVCLDLSAPALRRAARAHPRLAAVGADAWSPLPLAGRCAAVVLSVFGPRNPAELARVLAPGGVLVVATPTEEHLIELVEPLGMVHVDPDKDDRLAAALSAFTALDTRSVSERIEVDIELAADLALMGPAGKLTPTAELRERAERLGPRTGVSISVVVRRYRLSAPAAAG